jgi:hypothetical protein
MRQIAAALSTLAGIFQVSCAQPPVSPDPPRLTGEVRLHSNTVECFPDVYRCVIPVYVHARAGGECLAQIDAGTIIVPKKVGDQIKVVWVLKKGDKDTKINQYTFTAEGVKAKNGEPADQFFPDGYDEADPADPNPHETSGSGDTMRRYRWASKHPAGVGAGKAVKYDITVQRVTTLFGTRECNADPTIKNLDN